jgi:nucleotide-binding universal stress UspA family protein
MSYASIMVHVGFDHGAEARLHSARTVASWFDATLIGVGAAGPSGMVVREGGSGASDSWTEGRSSAAVGTDERSRAAETRLRAAARGLAKPAIWREIQAPPTRCVARASRAADLIVASRPLEGDPQVHADPAEMTLISGRPVLVCPSAPRELNAGRIVIAWKDTRESRRALADAMPLLKRASSVLVLAVCGRDDEEVAIAGVRDVADALKRHGVKAEAQILGTTGADGYAIMAEAGVFGADLIVAGAYGHSRLGEWMFGGVTRDLLAYCDRHVLISH